MLIFKYDPLKPDVLEHELRDKIKTLKKNECQSVNLSFKSKNYTTRIGFFTRIGYNFTIESVSFITFRKYKKRDGIFGRLFTKDKVEGELTEKGTYNKIRKKKKYELNSTREKIKEFPEGIIPRIEENRTYTVTKNKRLKNGKIIEFGTYVKNKHIGEYEQQHTQTMTTFKYDPLKTDVLERELYWKKRTLKKNENQSVRISFKPKNYTTRIEYNFIIESVSFITFRKYGLFTKDKVKGELIEKGTYNKIRKSEKYELNSTHKRCNRTYTVTKIKRLKNGKIIEFGTYVKNKTIEEPKTTEEHT